MSTCTVHALEATEANLSILSHLVHCVPEVLPGGTDASRVIGTSVELLGATESIDRERRWSASWRPPSGVESSLFTTAGVVIGGNEGWLRNWDGGAGWRDNGII